MTSTSRSRRGLTAGLGLVTALSLAACGGTSKAPQSAPAGGNGFTPRSDIPVDTNDFAAAPAGPLGGGSSDAGDDDIPF